MKYFRFLVCVLFATCSAQAAELDFNRDIRPILSDKCFHCHGPDEGTREAGFRLDRFSEELNEFGILVPGRIDESELWTRISSDDPDIMMPPPESNKPFTAEQRKRIKTWIEQGAGWSEHWAYVTPVDAKVPVVENTNWPVNALDHFILARLEHEGLAPSAQADPVTLLRRVSFDLTGLPPSTELSDWFLQAPESRYEELVNRLLQMPAYGERMAIYWLDLVRYADTVGYHGDQVQTVTPYRDWVIEAFNQDMPFDEMTRQQLAGDLLSNPNQSQLIATTYNRLLQTTHEGGLQEKEYRAIYQADRVRNVTAVWMGATVGCAQCHDHKYDPYTAKDFYALGAFFADIDDEQHFRSGSNDNPTRREPSLALPTPEQAMQEQQLRQARDDSWQLMRQADAKFKQAKEDPAANADQIKKLEQQHKAATAIYKKREAEHRTYDQQIRRTLITKALETPRTTRILPRGNWQDESGAIVAPAVPEFMGQIESAPRANRLDLANWLLEPQAGIGLLTARVMANRLWYLCFGDGLSRSLQDFGGQGEPPTHPELLDYLAHRFSEGWSIKALLKQIVLSRTYRQSSQWSDELKQRDPENRLLARQSAFRLPAEMIRDNALVLSGLLNRQVGGESAKPYQPKGYYRHLNFPVREYHADLNDAQYRRGVYVHWQRQFLHPMLKAFDAPNREECTAQRPQSNTPLAALTLMNDPTFLEASHAFAVRVQRSSQATFIEKIGWTIEQALNRKATDEELQVLTTVYEKALEFFSQSAEQTTQRLSVGMYVSEEVPQSPELAAMAEVCRVVLNLAETTMRN